MYGYKRFSSYPGRRLYNSGGYGRYYSRGTVGRAAAGAAAARRSDKSETYSCTVNGICTSRFLANQQMSNIKVFHPYQGGITDTGVPNDGANLVLGGAVNDRGFRMKCACYDEVKLDSMRVTLSPAQLMTNQNLSFTLCTMWDRKANPKECGFADAGMAWMANGAMPTAMEIFNNEGTMKSIMTGNQIYGYKRYARASSILEKGGYHDSSILYNDGATQSPLRYMYLDAWIRGALPFSPALFLTVYCPASLQGEFSVGLSYKVEYTFTFRNPKSDLDWFLTVESPGYVNPEPDGDGRAGAIERRTIDPILSRAFRTVYELNTGSYKSVAAQRDAYASLFAPLSSMVAVKSEDDDDEDDDKMGDSSDGAAAASASASASSSSK